MLLRRNRAAKASGEHGTVPAGCGDLSLRCLCYATAVNALCRIAGGGGGSGIADNMVTVASPLVLWATPTQGERAGVAAAP